MYSNSVICKASLIDNQGFKISESLNCIVYSRNNEYNKPMFVKINNEPYVSKDISDCCAKKESSKIAKSINVCIEYPDGSSSLCCLKRINDFSQKYRLEIWKLFFCNFNHADNKINDRNGGVDLFGYYEYNGFYPISNKELLSILHYKNVNKRDYMIIDGKIYVTELFDDSLREAGFIYNDLFGTKYDPTL